ncbi:MAG: hypothetical protein ACFFAS_11965 [Promethearchaeota archaeon]
MLYAEGVIHPLSEETYIWTYSLIYRNNNFDVIKFKSSWSWKDDPEGKQETILDKASHVGVIAGVFFIIIDEKIEENFSKLADMMDVFIDKTSGQEKAPFIVYGLIENKQKIAELKTNKEQLKNLADVKNWVIKHGGEFRLENLTEVKANMRFLISDYTHYILTNTKASTNYPGLKLGEVHFLDYDDLTALQEIEKALMEQLKAGETVDNLLSQLFFKYLDKMEFKEEIYEAPFETVEESVAETKPTIPPPSKIKIILEEIRRGIRRQCPKCFNMDRDMIREVLDHDNLIYDFGTDKIYGFKYICGQCGHEWRTEKDWKIEKENQ